MSGFKYSLYRNVGLAIEHYNMINNGDRVMVALSGGKDSFTLLDALTRLKLRAPVEFSLFVCMVHPGFPGFMINEIEQWLKDNKYEYHIERSDIYETVFQDAEKSKDGCFHCSRQRRSVLYRIADANNCQKIALGHHSDDFIETVLLSMFFNGKIETMLPIFEAGSKKFRIIRPLMYVSERTTADYAKDKEFPVACCGCPLCKTNTLRRAKVKKMLADFEKNDPKIKDTLFRSLSNYNAGYMLDLRYNQTLSRLKYENKKPPGATKIEKAV
ncbi:MAG TPA: ATP-binding protein [Candidatus Wallbacteria bacterium]|nr:ATP-binding protein [Candidatus Wallbacteria bacterium]